MPAVLIITAFPDKKKALSLAARLVRQGLAACVSLQDGVTSHYRWKGKLERSREVLLTIKTERRLYGKVEKAIIKHHPYELPEIISLPVSRGSKKYLSWIKNSVR